MTLSFICQRSRFATFSLSRTQRAVYAILHVQQLGQLGVESFVLAVSGVIFALQRCNLTLPLGNVDAVGQLAAGEIELTQLALVLGLELLAFGLPLDCAESVVEGLETLVYPGVPEQLAQLFRPLLVRRRVWFLSRRETNEANRGGLQGRQGHVGRSHSNRLRRW